MFRSSLAVVFAAFVTGAVTGIKELGVGAVFAILLDATVVRGMLVPALMRVFGELNWLAPRPLRALHDRIGLSEGRPAAAPAARTGRPEPEPAPGNPHLS